MGECVSPLDITTKPPHALKQCVLHVGSIKQNLEITPVVLLGSSQSSYKEGLYESSLHLACFTEGTWAKVELYR